MHTKHVELNRLRAEIKTETRRLNLEKVSLLCAVEAKLHEMPIGYGDSKLTSINFSDISLLEVGSRNEVSEGVYFEKTYDDGEKIILLTYMEKGGSFGVHSHDCVELVEY